MRGVYEGHGVTLHHLTVSDVLRTLPDASVDSVVTDPPYNPLVHGQGLGYLPDPQARTRASTGINLSMQAAH